MASASASAENTIPYLFDNLPLEIILYEIIPYLDYFSKNTVNCMLPPQDRMRTPINPEKILQLDIHIARNRLVRLLMHSYKESDDSILTREISNYSVALQYNQLFREEFPKLLGYRRLFPEVAAVLNKPFIREVEPIKTWVSFIKY
jgi:hypothetical protein